MKGLKSRDSFSCLCKPVSSEDLFPQMLMIIKIGFWILGYKEADKSIRCFKKMLILHIVLAQNVFWIIHFSSVTRVLVNFAVEILVEPPPFLVMGAQHRLEKVEVLQFVKFTQMLCPLG